MNNTHMPHASAQRGAKSSSRQLPVIARLDIVALLALSALLALFVFANIELLPVSADKRANLALGLSLSKTGRFGGVSREETEVYYRREPFYPATIALVDLLVGALNDEQVPMECAGYEPAQTNKCLALYAPYIGINGVYLTIAALVVFLIVFWTTGNRLLGYSSYLLVATSSALLRHSVSFYSELPAAALMALSAALAVRSLRRPGPFVFAALGLTLAALTLTKVVFAHLWWITALTFVAATMLRDRSERRPLVVGVLIMAAAYLVPVGGWMTRNALLGGEFALVEQRAFKVNSVRASYNRMTDEEYRLGFLYYLPHVGERGLERMGIDPAKFARFNTRNPEGFRKIGQHEYKERSLVLAKAAAGLAPPHATIETLFGSGRVPPRVIAKQVAAEAKREILSDPWQHLKVSVLLAVRGAFPERGLGFDWRPKADRSIGDLAGLDWVSRIGYRYPREMITVLNLFTGVGLLLLPLVMFSRGRDLSGLLIVLPALYSHGIYALVSHFIPRYSIPEIPLRIAAALVLVGLLFNALGTLVRRNRRCLQDPQAGATLPQ